MIRCGRWVAALLVVACGACVQRPVVPLRSEPVVAIPAEPASASPVDPEPSGSAVPPDAAAPDPAAAAPAPAGGPRLPDHPALAAIGAPDALQASRLVGKTIPDIEGLFGRAHFVRVDKGTELRQYRNTSCVLDLFLYPDEKTRIPKVEYADVRSRQGGKPDENACLTDLLRAHWMPPGA